MSEELRAMFADVAAKLFRMATAGELVERAANKNEQPQALEVG